MMSNKSNHEAALFWVFRSLLDEISELVNSRAEIEERAETLLAIAEQHELPVEQLVEWIHRKVPGKQWSAAEFRGFAQKYSDAQQQLARTARAFGVCLHCGRPLHDAASAEAHVCGGASRP